MILGRYDGGQAVSNDQDMYMIKIHMCQFERRNIVVSDNMTLRDYSSAACVEASWYTAQCFETKDS